MDDQWIRDCQGRCLTEASPHKKRVRERSRGGSRQKEEDSHILPMITRGERYLFPIAHYHKNTSFNRSIYDNTEGRRSIPNHTLEKRCFLNSREYPIHLPSCQGVMGYLFSIDVREYSTHLLSCQGYLLLLYTLSGASSFFAHRRTCIHIYENT